MTKTRAPGVGTTRRHHRTTFRLLTISLLVIGWVFLNGEIATTHSLLEWESFAGRVAAGAEFIVPSVYWGEGGETYLHVRNLGSMPASIELEEVGIELGAWEERVLLASDLFGDSGSLHRSLVIGHTNRGNADLEIVASIAYGKEPAAGYVTPLTNREVRFDFVLAESAKSPYGRGSADELVLYNASSRTVDIDLAALDENGMVFLPYRMRLEPGKRFAVFPQTLFGRSSGRVVSQVYVQAGESIYAAHLAHTPGGARGIRSLAGKDRLLAEGPDILRRSLEL